MNTPITIKDYARLLNDGTRFVQTNYGDGEWACILGYGGGNCNGEKYEPGIQQALIDTILNPIPGLVFYGSNPTVKHEAAAQAWLAKNNAAQRAWVFKEVFPNANAQGEFGHLIAAIRRRRTLLIGPAHLNAHVYKLFNILSHTHVPVHNAYTARDTVYTEAMIRIKRYDPDLILVCSGMAANPMIWRLGAELPNTTIIDLGAALDPYAGVQSRNAHRKPEFQQQMLPRNITAGLAAD